MKIEFITDDPVVAEHFKVEPIKKFVPHWYKEIPSKLGPETALSLSVAGTSSERTIKSCTPVQDYLTSGYLIRTTEHTKMENLPSKEEGKPDDVTYFSSKKDYIGLHSHEQCPVHLGGRKRTYIKFINPWTIKTPPGYSCLFMQPFFHDLEPPYRLLPGIVDTDTYPIPVNFPGWIDTDQTVEVPPGAALMTVFPFKRDSWEAVITYEEKRKETLMNKFLHGAYKKLFWKAKSYK